MASGVPAGIQKKNPCGSRPDDGGAQPEQQRVVRIRIAVSAPGHRIAASALAPHVPDQQRAITRDDRLSVTMDAVETLT
jgi:hypothetical protein